MLNFSQKLEVIRMSPALQYCLLYSATVLLFYTGCTEVTYSDLEDGSKRETCICTLGISQTALCSQAGQDVSYLYLDEEEPFEEEDLASDCGDTYYDWIALYCWPKFHAAILGTHNSNRCLWETVGSIYGELALCTGLLAEGLGCPMSSPTLDAFFVRIHAEYFSNCSLPPSTSAPQPHLGTVIVLTSLSVCLVPISVVLVLHKA